ncbi:MAG TPA: 50S ribosomal protein L11 methyltransferase [Candidatus Polarisedimenticolia bacterium]|nr:50S ribosomal protein L11 methyltransferase [Candidatus Polarisedimenticolia bacterium]
MARSRRAFILRHTRLRPVPGLEEVRLHLADDALELWRAVQVETGDPDAPIPFWAFAWGGGLALGRYLREHPEAVAGRRVLDFGSGSGIVAIAAMLARAKEVVATDIDPMAVSAIELNARANASRVTPILRDVLADPAPDTEVILAADCWYEAAPASRVMPWLQRARAAGIDVLVGDPGRRYLPLDDLAELARYEVRTTTELEDLDHKQASVYELRGADPRRGSATA